MFVQHGMREDRNAALAKQLRGFRKKRAMEAVKPADRLRLEVP